MRSLRLTTTAALSSLVVAHSAVAFAQTTAGGIASATVSAVRIEDGTSASIAGALGYRFNSIVSLGVELMAVPNLTPELPDIPTPLGALGFESVVFPAPTVKVDSDGGHATIFT